MTFGPTFEKREIARKVLGRPLQAENNKYKGEVSYQPEKASVIELIEAGLNTGKRADDSLSVT